MSSSTQLNSSSSPEVATMESISTAMKAIERKREDLHKAFQMVQSHSQTLTLFNLNWTDLDQYFNSIQQTLESRFKELESKEQNLQNHNKPIPKSTPKTPQSQQTQTLIKHPELKTFCEKMDGKGLCVYIMTNRNDLQAIKTEALSAFKSVGDPSKLVVDALKSFNGKEMKKGDRMNEFGSFRRSCVLLLEALSLSKPEIKPSVREEAKKVAFEWKKNKGKDVQLENISFLLLVATFGLVSEFSTNELLDMLVAIARCKQSIELFQALGFSDQIHDFIRKLNCGRMQLVALKFVFAFNIADKFPPVPLLEDYLKDCKEAVEEVHKKGNNSLQSQNEAIAKEISFLTTMVKSIEEHKLESQYPRESLDKRIAQLEKEKVDRKHYAKSPATVKQQQPQQSGKKHPQPLATNTPVVSNPLQQMGLLPDPVAARYLPVLTQQGVTGPSPSASHYGLVSASQYGMQGPSPSASQYGLPGPSLSASQYGIQGPSPVSQYGVVAPNQSMPNLYSSETQMASDLYGRTLGYGGYGTQASFGQLPYFYGAQ